MNSENYIMCGSTLPEDYQPCDHTVKIGRGRSVTSHEGNIRFQTIVKEHKQAYEAANSRSLKTEVIMQVIRQVKSKSVGNIGFVKKNPATGRWVALQTISTRTSVGQAFRDLLKGKYKSSKHCKQVMRDLEKTEEPRSVENQSVPNQDISGSSFKCPFPVLSLPETNLARMVSLDSLLPLSQSSFLATEKQETIRRQSWVDQLCTIMIPDDSPLESSGNPFEPLPLDEADVSVSVPSWDGLSNFVPNVIDDDFSF